MSKSTFARLPVELLKQIRSNVHSLKDVVAFSQINKSTAKICDEAYWKKVLIVAGFGRPSKPLVKLPKKWGALARIICADSKRYAGHSKKYGKHKYITELSCISLQVIYETAWSELDFEVLDGENPRYLKWRSALGTKDEFDPKGTAFTRTARITGNEVNISWADKVEEVWTSPVYDYGAGDDEGGVDDSEDDGKEDYPGPLALLHPYITCRLICTPMAGVVTTGTDWYGNFGATVKNKNGVTYGDVMHALARQIANVHDVSEMMGDHQYFEGFEYSDGMVPHLSFHFGS